MDKMPPPLLLSPPPFEKEADKVDKMTASAPAGGAPLIGGSLAPSGARQDRTNGEEGEEGEEDEGEEEGDDNDEEGEDDDDEQGDHGDKDDTTSEPASEALASSSKHGSTSPASAPAPLAAAQHKEGVASLSSTHSAGTDETASVASASAGAAIASNAIPPATKESAPRAQQSTASSVLSQEDEDADTRGSTMVASNIHSMLPSMAAIVRFNSILWVVILGAMCLFCYCCAGREGAKKEGGKLSQSDEVQPADDLICDELAPPGDETFETLTSLSVMSDKTASKRPIPVHEERARLNTQEDSSIDSSHIDDGIGPHTPSAPTFSL
jgi:hypothetical protein